MCTCVDMWSNVSRRVANGLAYPGLCNVFFMSQMTFLSAELYPPKKIFLPNQSLTQQIFPHRMEFDVQEGG